MNEQVQKRFLDARQRYKSAQRAWHLLGHIVVDVATAFEHPRPNYERGWYQIKVVGTERSYPHSFLQPGDRSATRDPSKWLTGEQIANAWREVNLKFLFVLACR